jgi:hypothetical protein
MRAKEPRPASRVSIAIQRPDGGSELTILFAALLVCRSHRCTDRRGKLPVDLALGLVDVADSLSRKIVESRLKNHDVVAQSGDA